MVVLKSQDPCVEADIVLLAATHYDVTVLHRNVWQLVIQSTC